jgi:hypothetical protein
MVASTGFTIQQAAARLGRDPAVAVDRHFAQRRPTVAQPKAQEPVTSGGLLLWFCLFLLVFTATVLLAVFLIGAEIRRAGHSSDTTLHEIVIGNDVLAVPANMIRFRSQRRSGEAQRIDLYGLWPEMSGYSEANKAEFNKTTVNPALIFITLEPRQMSQDMTGRIEPIYSKFLKGEPVKGGYGLMRQTLSQEGGFYNEDLWFEVNSPYPFAARCMRADTDGAAPYCLRDIHVGQGLSVTYRFHLSLIGEWLAIDAAVRAQVKAMLRG